MQKCKNVKIVESQKNRKIKEKGENKEFKAQHCRIICKIIYIYIINNFVIPYNRLQLHSYNNWLMIIMLRIMTMRYGNVFLTFGCLYNSLFKSKRLLVKHIGLTFLILQLNSIHPILKSLIKISLNNNSLPSLEKCKW